MREVILDVETQRAFVGTGGYDPAKLGVSYVGICQREFLSGANGAMDLGEERFLGFFEDKLGDLWPILEKADRIIGFNIRGFDLPVLSAYYNGDFSSFPVLDILEEVKKAVEHRVSLDAIAKQTLGVEKRGTGLDALTFYEQGRLKELASYCLSDVRITRDVYDFGRINGYLKFMDKWNRVVSVPVDFSFKGESRVQMSLGM